MFLPPSLENFALPWKKSADAHGCAAKLLYPNYCASNSEMLKNNDLNSNANGQTVNDGDSFVYQTRSVQLGKACKECCCTMGN